MVSRACLRASARPPRRPPRTYKRFTLIYFTSSRHETGTVKRIADGLTDKRSPRARSVLPAGAVLWAWDEDPDFDEQVGEQWLILVPKKWNPTTHKAAYSWRYDPRELGAARATPADARREH